jgi:hypothetical protein
MMRRRYANTCACRQEVAKGEQAGHDAVAKKVVCLACLSRREAPVAVEATPEAPTTSGPPASVAGGSLRRTHDQRAAAGLRTFGGLRMPPTASGAQGA